MNPQFEKLTTLLDSAVERGGMPSVSAVVGDTSQILWHHYAGVTAVGSTLVTENTLYDLASLTKVMSTLPLILQLVTSGEFTLDDTVGCFFSSAGWFQSPSIADCTIASLLTHTSGLPAWAPYFAQVESRRTVIAAALQSPVKANPGPIVYSDIGYIILGALIERVMGDKQSTIATKYLFEPMGLKTLSYGPLDIGAYNHDVAATEDCSWRNALLCGTVHDENAHVMEGVSGHAGLFGSARDVALYCRAWLQQPEHFSISSDLFFKATQVQANYAGKRRGFGWEMKPLGQDGVEGFASDRVSGKGFGHTGYTGGSLWIEPEQGWYAVLLTNRVHPSRHSGSSIHSLRQQFYRLCAQSF